MPHTPVDEYLTVTLDSSYLSGGWHTVDLSSEVVNEDNNNIVTFLDDDNISNIWIAKVGKDDNAPDEFHFNLNLFDDTFYVGIMSEGPEDTFYLSIGNSGTFSVDGGGTYTINYTGLDGNPHTVTLDPGDASVVIAMNCFTPGTLIETPEGKVRAEDLQVGDSVVTLDNGAQQLRWIGHRKLEFGADENRHKPILHPAGSLGASCPSRDLIVSPQHKMFLKGDAVTKVSGSTQTLAPSKAMIGHKGTRQMSGKRDAEYISLMLDRHEIIFAEDAATESFRPGPMALKSLAEMDRKELFELVPELGLISADEIYELARPEISNRNVQKILDAMKDEGVEDIGLNLQSVTKADRIPDRPLGVEKEKSLIQKVQGILAAFFHRQSAEDLDSDAMFIRAD